MDVKLIAMDLDGTLLHTDKSFSERNKRALDAAADERAQAQSHVDELKRLLGEQETTAAPGLPRSFFPAL